MNTANIHDNSITQEAFRQQIENLPTEILDQPRFFPVAESKVPLISEWQKPENQHHAAQIQGLKGFDTCGHGRAVDYLLIDFDHVLDDAGNFNYPDAERWYNYISQSGNNIYCERSKSGDGLHFICRPTVGKFPKVTNSDKNRIYFDKETGAKIELFYLNAARYCFVTGNLFHCEPNATIPHDEDADEIFQQLLNTIAKNQPAHPPKAQTQPQSLRNNKSPDYPDDTPEYNLFRAMRMLDVIPPAELGDADWLAVNSACKNENVPSEVVDAFNRRDPERYNEAENKARWDSLNDPSYDIETLHGIAKRFGYSEADTRRDWYAQHPEIRNHARRQKQRNVPPELLLSEEQKEFLFQGNSSDKACARRLIHFFGNRVRYLQLDDSWLTFNQNIHGGGIWTNGGTKNAVLYPFALELSERLEANATTEHESKLAAAFTSTKKFSSTISMMKSFDSIIIKAEDLDQHPELLNCKNGVVDLESGKFYPTVAPSLLITKQANAVFRGINFRDEHVDKFLTSIQPNADTRAALLRYLGYGCTGLIRDHVLQLWRGDGRNGKSTLILLVRSALGTYAVKLPTTAILDTGREIDPNAPTPALSPLEGARLAICDELPRTAHINAALCKTLSGGDEIVIRKLRAECKTIKPTAKIILNGNFNPTVDDVNDLGLRERIRNMPFNQTFTGNRADPCLTEKLSTDDARSAMLSILVAEACAWFSEGLIESAEMVAAKDEYLTANDFVGEFVETYCEDKREGFIDIKAFVEKLQAKSAEARRTPERLLKDMVKNWFKLKGKDNVQYKQHPRTRRAGFSGIDWSYTDEDFDDINAFVPPN